MTAQRPALTLVEGSRGSLQADARRWVREVAADPFAQAVVAELGDGWGTGDLATDERIYQRARRIARDRLAIERLKAAA